MPPAYWVLYSAANLLPTSDYDIISFDENDVFQSNEKTGSSKSRNGAQGTS